MELDPRPGPGDRTLYLSQEAEIGTKGPFRVAYADELGNRRWGYFCTNCETFDNAMDSMGRIRCNVCANHKQADEWDAAHE